MSYRFAMKSHFACLLALSITACAVESSPDVSGGDAYAEDGDDVTSELRAKPRYTFKTREVLGEYTSDGGCAGGFDACDSVEIMPLEEGEGLRIWFGGPYGFDAPLRQTKNGVLVFSTAVNWADCDDPGCGDLRHISGVVYPVAKKGKWVPQVKATYLAEFRYPDEQGAPEGEVKTVLHLTKK